MADQGSLPRVGTGSSEERRPGEEEKVGRRVGEETEDHLDRHCLVAESVGEACWLRRRRLPRLGVVGRVAWRSWSLDVEGLLRVA